MNTPTKPQTMPERNFGYAIVMSVRDMGRDRYLNLSVVMGARPDEGKFVTWTYNHANGGFEEGHYFSGAGAECRARMDYRKRLS